ncbi:TonB-dependent receptor plug domain-containing protein [Chelatococcus reniformis]|uniref:TonB-dependent receptor n=1 Tax=Chelatococcus reniformis TaxID=1494448 RepID=A0A916UQB1_9HYPH|nr:TonB-dependent receptor [Chelatococcus reniformis]GGC81999.1 TonB-dependent receptor [Chelatococcus reniformis]
MILHLSSAAGSSALSRGIRAGTPALAISRRALAIAALALGCVAAWPDRAIAQQAGGAGSVAPDTAPVVLDDIVVSATGIPTDARLIPNSVTVITEQEIEERQQRTLPDALTVVPGLNVVSTGGPGGQTSVFIRGTNSNHVKVLIDGIEANNPAVSNGAFDFGQLLTYDLARIEVLRGPQSGLYGADAIGGVISLITKKGDGPPRASVLAEAGSFGTFNQAGSLSGGNERINYAFNVAHYRAEGVPVTPGNLVPPGQRINPNFYDNWTASGRVGIAVTDNLELNLISRYTDSRLLFTTDSGFPSQPNAFRSLQDNNNYYGRAEAVWTLLDGRFRNVFGLNYTNAWSRNQEPPTIAGPVDPSDSRGERLKFDWRGELALMQGQTLVMGLEHKTDRLATSDLTAENRNRAGFVELQSNFSDRVFIVSNIRYDDNQQFGGHTTWRVAPAVIVPGSETKLKGSVGTGFKAPSLSELYQNFPAFDFYGNPNLRPEESIGWDAGFEQPLWHDRVRFGATYFHNKITNLITTNADFTSYTNIGRAKTYGVESFLAIAFSDTLSARMDYTFTVAKDEDANQELLRRPKNKVSTTLTWLPIDKLTLSATAVALGSWVDGNRDFSIPRLKAPGYATVNLAANYQYSDAIMVFARIDNLLDRHYEDPTGFLGRGFAAYGGAKFTW